MLAWSGSSVATTVSFGGVTVDSGGSMTPAGIDPATVPAPHTGKVKYFIPLNESTSGVYGVDPVTCHDGTAGKVGECADVGTGFGLATANALTMNLFFDLPDDQPDSVAASLWFHFKDLDLDPTNDPNGFRESIVLSYWDVDSSSFEQVGGVIDHASELTSGVFSGVADTSPPPAMLDHPNDDPLMWEIDLAALDLSLAALDILDDLNDSVSTLGGFWIQLGFGSEYVDAYGKPREGKNTPEYLTAQLHVSPVPIPSAVWLFGSALIGFIGLSRRTRV